jgi:hypothetical protein
VTANKKLLSSDKYTNLFEPFPRCTSTGTRASLVCSSSSSIAQKRDSLHVNVFRYKRANNKKSGFDAFTRNTQPSHDKLENLLRARGLANLSYFILYNLDFDIVRKRTKTNDESTWSAISQTSPSLSRDLLARYSLQCDTPTNS